MPAAIWGRARSTASATFLSSRLMTRAISSAESVSNSPAARFARSVPRSLMLMNVVYLDAVGINRLHPRIMKRRPDLFDSLRAPIGPCAVGQQRNRKLPVRVNPQGGSCVAQVAIGPWRKVFSGLRGRGRGVPAQGARSSCRKVLAPCKKFHSVGLEQRRPAVKQALGEGSDRFRRAETAGMTGHAAHDPGVFVVNLALDHAMAKPGVVLGGRKRLRSGLLRMKANGQTEWGTNFPFVEAVQRFVRDPF